MDPRVIIVVALVVLAGYAGGLPAFGEDGSDDPTLTATDGTDGPTATASGDSTSPTATPDGDSATPTGRTDANASREYLAPGLTADGVSNVSMLLDHHFAALEAESGDGTYEIVTRTEMTANGSRTFETERRLVVQHPDHWRETVARTSYGPNATETTVHEQWAEESRFLSRTEAADGLAEYDTYETRGLREPSFVENRLAHWLGFGHAWNPGADVEEQSRDGTTWYVVSGAFENDWGTMAFRYHVREDGRIERMALASVGASSGTEIVSDTTSVEFHADPNGTLDRPAWYDEARNATGTEGG